MVFPCGKDSETKNAPGELVAALRDYKEISFVCLRPDGCLELPTTLGTVCRKVAKTLEGFEGFHFHQLRKRAIVA